MGSDAEEGSYIPPTLEENANTNIKSKIFDTNEQSHVRRTARMWFYAFQIIFQVSFLPVIARQFYRTTADAKFMNSLV